MEFTYHTIGLYAGLILSILALFRYGYSLPVQVASLLTIPAVVIGAVIAGVLSLVLHVPMLYVTVGLVVLLFVGFGTHELTQSNGL